MNDNENVPDLKGLKGLAEFINGNKQNNLLNIQCEGVMSMYHPQTREARANIYVDATTYDELMKLVGGHNPADDYEG